MKKRNLLLSVSLVSLALVACGQDAPKTPEKTSVATKQVTTEKSTTVKKTKVQHTKKQSQSTDNDQVAATENQDKVATQDSDTSSKDTTDKDTKKEEAVKEDTTSATSEMDVAAIQEGDFSSIAGTWVDGKGHTIVFDENGLVRESSSIEKMEMQDNGTLLANVASGYSGFAMVFVPEGKDMSTGKHKDPSNQNKDRIWAGHQGPEDDSEFYYKVD